jgi:leucyl-tRNA synthetase
MVKLVVYVNVKVKDRLEMNAGTNREEAEQLALAAPKVQSHLEGRQVRKVIVVPKRLVDIVCG